MNLRLLIINGNSPDIKGKLIEGLTWDRLHQAILQKEVSKGVWEDLSLPLHRVVSENNIMNPELPRSLLKAASYNLTQVK